ncbi:PEP-CTERM sorting domain-containing protein [Methylibium sp.]|uniref:PEP-CTERM sorting domain-containing protein n=1 Tax=Methylibium sp. TaxID=2067992 RepID=UPI0025DCA9DB|nr:PEP-CTERM sorting domain-containing protein [Methylibium sp.]
MNIRTICAAAALCMTATAQAALFDRGGGMIYDSSQNITWLQDGNYAATSGYVATEWYGDSYPYGDSNPLPPGYMSFWTQVQWADSLTVGGYTDWRTPRALLSVKDGSIEMFSTPGSTEMHNLFIQLGSPAVDQTTAGPFFNIQPTYVLSGVIDGDYQSSDKFEDGEFYSSVYANWGELGDQDFQIAYVGAWAVRDGDVMAAIPEPSTYALMLAGLGLVGWAARKRP